MQARISLVCPCCGRPLPTRTVLDRYLSCLATFKGKRASAAQVADMLHVRRNIAGKRLTQLAGEGKVRIIEGKNGWNEQKFWMPRIYELVTQT